MKTIYTIGLCLMIIALVHEHSFAQTPISTEAKADKNTQTTVHPLMLRRIIEVAPQDSAIKLEVLNREKKAIEVTVNISNEKGEIIHAKAWSGTIQSGVHDFILDTSLCKNGIYNAVILAKNKQLLIKATFNIQR